MHQVKRAVGTIAATTLITSGLAATATTASAAEPAAEQTASDEQLIQELLGLLIQGIGQVGENLSVVPPLGDGLPLLDAWDIQWLRDGVPIPGADQWDYIPAPEDLGHEIQAKVTGLLLGLPVVSGLTEALQISEAGVENPGEQLQLLVDLLITQLTDRLQVPRPGADGWSLPGVEESIQWFRDLGTGGVPIPGADEWEYLPQPADFGGEIYAVVTGALAGIPLVAQVTDRIELPGTAVAATTPPQIQRHPIHGAQVGAVLIAKDPEWSTEGVENTYQWQLAGADIGGATDAEYTVRPQDVDKRLTVVVTGTATHPFTQQEMSGTSTSDPVTAEKGAAPTALLRPSITGTPEVGEQLGVQPGTWTYATEGVTPEVVTYHWLRDGVLVGTGPTYRVAKADAGRALSVRATATHPAFEDGTATSQAVDVPVDGPGVEQPPATKADSEVRVRLADARIPRRSPAVLKFAVHAGGTTPTGKVRIVARSKAGKARTVVPLRAQHDGVRKVRLPKRWFRKPGKYHLRVVYLGSTQVERGRSAKATLRVLRRRR